jgi:hypothetical protein
MPDETLYDLQEGTLFPLNHKTRKVTYTIREDKLARFNSIVEKNNMNKSGIIETLMDSFLENFEKQKLKLA